MNKVSLINGMVYQSGKRIERKNILVCDGVIVDITDNEINEGNVIDCDDLLIAPNFKSNSSMFSNIDIKEVEQGTFAVLYKSLVQTHKVTLERLLDFMSGEKIEVGGIANFTIVDLLSDCETQSLSISDANVSTLNLQFN